MQEEAQKEEVAREQPKGCFFHANFDRAEVAKLRRRRDATPSKKHSGERKPQ